MNQIITPCFFELSSYQMLFSLFVFTVLVSISQRNSSPQLTARGSLTLQLLSWQLFPRKSCSVGRGSLFSADDSVTVTTTWGQVSSPALPRSIQQLCRKIGVMLNPSPAPVSCSSAAMRQEPLCGFANPQGSRYRAKGRLPAPANSQAVLGMAGFLPRDTHQPPTLSPTIM